MLLLCACAVRYTLAFATGAPLEACATISPALGHTSPPNEAVGASPTTLDLNGLNNGLFYCPAESYTGIYITTWLKWERACFIELVVPVEGA